MNFSSRVTKLNKAQENTKGRYVLYWMQMFKRASHNYALNFAIEMANKRRLPLVVYEGLKGIHPCSSVKSVFFPVWIEDASTSIIGRNQS